ncbi:TraR/DksA family transcriptional regulator [Streptomyces xanthii]|uniref:TraR/DksA C4-type zinc finger protein n=1 Tax=Streptomyces xanthii TaxID=2768069 RepID=A0A7H1BJ58_9ACTN|nr:TraR/DksA C4-type zinc finger protein [Streptomyces xanthii]QNS08763.1 TraR/DksA C4-type zinc finger protein [Streptomyces xanthii]
MSLDGGRGRAAAHPDEARRRLEHARASRLTQLDALDARGQSAEDHLLVAQRTAMREVLGEIEAAFGRVDDGTYGICQGCARPVPAERLEILPYTRHCVGCRPRAV